MLNRPLFLCIPKSSSGRCQKRLPEKHIEPVVLRDLSILAPAGGLPARQATPCTYTYILYTITTPAANRVRRRYVCTPSRLENRSLPSGVLCPSICYAPRYRNTNGNSPIQQKVTGSVHQAYTHINLWTGRSLELHQRVGIRSAGPGLFSSSAGDLSVYVHDEVRKCSGCLVNR